MTWNRLLHVKSRFSFSWGMDTCLPFGVESDKLCSICISILSFENMLNLKHFMTNFTIDPWISLLGLWSHRNSFHLCIHLCLQISSRSPSLHLQYLIYSLVVVSHSSCHKKQTTRHSPYSRQINLISNQIKLHYIIF